MEALTLRDQKALLECIRQVHGERDAERFPTALLAALARVIPGSSFFFQEIDVRDATAGMTVQWPETVVRPDDFARFQVLVRRDHPLPAHYARFPHGGPCRLSDFLTRRRYHHTELYADGYRALRIEHQISVPIGMRYPLFRGVIINRDATDFTERERRILDQVRVHADLARRNVEAFTGLRCRLHDAERALDDGERGMIVVDRDGRVRMRTERARAWERAYLGRPRSSGRLAEPLSAWMDACLARLARLDDAPSAWSPLVVTHGEKRLVVRLLPDVRSGEHVLVMELRHATPPPRALARLGLSRRETEVLGWVVLGKTNAETATILDLSPRTVQKHLEHVFAKLGVETRTAAVACAWESMAYGTSSPYVMT